MMSQYLLLRVRSSTTRTRDRSSWHMLCFACLLVTLDGVCMCASYVTKLNSTTEGALATMAKSGTHAWDKIRIGYLVRSIFLTKCNPTAPWWVSQWQTRAAVLFSIEQGRDRMRCV